MANQFVLLRSRRFLPLFLVQFLGAFNDYLLKTALMVLIAYGLWDIDGWDPAVLIAVASALFILPFILVTPLAGNMSDKFDKAVMIGWIKFVEVVIALFAIVVLFIGDLYLAFIVLLALGAQSAFFSPSKFAILPQHLNEDELVAGNGLVSSGTYIAILLGTIIGTLLAPLEGGKIMVSGVLFVAAIMGYVASRFVPTAKPPQPDLNLSFDILGQAIGVVRDALRQRASVMVAILGTSYFYFVASTFHAQFPNFAKTTLGADNIVLAMFMLMFSVGIVVGGLLNHRFLKARPDGVFVPVACLFMGLFGVDIYFAAKAYPVPLDGSLHDLPTFLSSVHGVRLLVDTFLQAVACGFYVVPLRAIVQHRAEEQFRSRVISSSNMMDAVFVLIAAVFSIGLLSFGISVVALYLIVSVLTVLVAGILFKMPSLRNLD